MECFFFLDACNCGVGCGYSLSANLSRGVPGIPLGVRCEDALYRLASVFQDGRSVSRWVGCCSRGGCFLYECVPRCIGWVVMLVRVRGMC